MQCPQQAVDLIKRWEGCRLQAYRCPAGVWTIGWGHTGSGVVSGSTCAQAEADAWLQQACDHLYTWLYNLLVSEPNENQMSALVSFTYNLGQSAFARSALRRLVDHENWAAASREFGRYTRAGGRVLQGLVARRAAEQQLFDKPVTM